MGGVGRCGKVGNGVFPWSFFTPLPAPCPQPCPMSPALPIWGGRWLGCGRGGMGYGEVWGVGKWGFLLPKASDGLGMEVLPHGVVSMCRWVGVCPSCFSAPYPVPQLLILFLSSSTPHPVPWPHIPFLNPLSSSLDHIPFLNPISHCWPLIPFLGPISHSSTPYPVPQPLIQFLNPISHSPAPVSHSSAPIPCSSAPYPTPLPKLLF